MKQSATCATMVSDGATDRLPDAELLTGRVSEWGELLGVLEERHGLTVVVSDPWSGTSSLLVAAADEVGKSCALVDARSCADTLDLATSLADCAVATHAAEALGWWLGTTPPASTAGLRLWRVLRDRDIVVDDLRRGRGRATDRLREALELTVVLSSDQPTVIIDHLGRMLAAMRGASAGEVLDVLRSARQRHHELDLVLVDHPQGPVTTALSDERHPLYRAGGRLRFTRPSPDRIVGDLAITRPMTDVSVELLRTAAALASGVPELTWRTIAMAPRGSGDEPARALAGWRALRAANEPSTRHTWDLLRRVHPYAQSVVAAVSLGNRPHTAGTASKTVNDALTRLRDSGLAWQPAERTWAISDPLLTAWVREHPPPRARRHGAGIPRLRAAGGADAGE